MAAAPGRSVIIISVHHNFFDGGKGFCLSEFFRIFFKCVPLDPGVREGFALAWLFPFLDKGSVNYIRKLKKVTAKTFLIPEGICIPVLVQNKFALTGRYPFVNFKHD